MTREQLIASLTATDNNALYLDDERYFDWSTSHDGLTTFEAGDGADTVQLDLTRSEIESLHQRLTLWLLADAE